MSSSGQGSNNAAEFGAQHWNFSAMEKAEASEFDDKSSYLRQVKAQQSATEETDREITAAAFAGQEPKRSYRGLDPTLINIASEVLDTTRTELMVSYRFLDRALWKMPFKASEVISGLGTDGIDFNFNPEQILLRYSESTNEAVRDYLHLILHCVFYHPFIGNDVSLLAWNVASDIVVEQSCIELAGERFPSKGDDNRLKVIGALQDRLGNLSAEKIYQHILSTGMSPEEAELFEKLFHRDDHAPWYKDRPLEDTETDDAERGQTSPEPEPEDVADDAAHDNSTSAGESALDGGADDDDGDQDNADGTDNSDSGTDSDANEDDDSDDSTDSDSEGLSGTNGDGNASDSDDGMQPNETTLDGPSGSGKENWEDVSKQLRVELQTRSQQFGTEAGTLAQQLQVANRRRYDFRDFLKRFTQIDEEMMLNDDEFDLVSYTYGLRVFGNLPLIEPLEYKETKKIREFVIAIDTSESCDGGLIKRFCEETFSILKSSESFFSAVNVHIMQCDARVQSDVKIESQEQFDAYMNNFTVYGLGGTDFRPVFSRIDRLIEKGEFENLRGVIYFTDGYGTFPSSVPDYETVFVFLDDGFGAPTVPAWAYKLVLDGSDIRGTGPYAQ